MKNEFSYITNLHNYSEFSNWSENKVDHLSNSFYGICNNQFSENDTWFVSISNMESPIVKMGNQISSFAYFNDQNLSYNTVNYTELLNNLICPGYSTNFIFNKPDYNRSNNYFDIDNEIGNSCNIANEFKHFMIGCVNATILPPRIIERPKEKQNKNFVAELFQKSPNDLKSVDALNRKDVEIIIVELFRKEVELCSY